MAGELVPLVLIPRYTTYCGTAAYSTIGMDVTPYQNAIVNFWRNTMIGTGSTVSLYFEESSDQNLWSLCTGMSPNPASPAANAETQYTANLTKRWFRIRVVLPNADNVATCYAVGFLEERET